MKKPFAKVFSKALPKAFRNEPARATSGSLPPPPASFLADGAGNHLVDGVDNKLEDK